MSFIILIVLFAALGIGLGLLFNKLVIKNFPETGRKMNYVKTVIIFFLITVVLFAAVFGKFKIDSSVKNYSNEIEQYIIKNHSNLDFVRNGLNISAVSNDISKLNKTVTDLNVILKPKADELGVPNLVYNAVVNYVAKELQKKLVIVNKAEKAANSFVDENNFLTVSSLINGIRTGILKVVKTIVFVIVIICVILLVIYILVSLSTASKEKERVGSKDAG
jgi:ABC-type multidrug transport system fused ATPase/permease subunit